MSDNQSDRFIFKDAMNGTGLTDKVSLVLAAWFGTGLIPRAPGTCGSLAAIPFILLIGPLGLAWTSLVVLAFIVLSVGVAGRTARLLDEDDPSVVVIDEVAGMAVALFLVPQSWLSLALGFVLFRLFDILKPYPINFFEKIEGGKGIVSDDLAAGVYANLCLRVILLFTSG
jgi:phosphatidylglycerophosphatase A